MIPNYDNMVILRIAKYYYLYNLSQQDIDTARAFARLHGNLLRHVFYDDNERLILPWDYT